MTCEFTLEHWGWRILLARKWHHLQVTRNVKVPILCLHGGTCKYIENSACYLLTGDMMSLHLFTIVWTYWCESWVPFTMATCLSSPCLPPGPLWCVDSLQLYHLHAWWLYHRFGNWAFLLSNNLTEVLVSSFRMICIHLGFLLFSLCCTLIFRRLSQEKGFQVAGDQHCPQWAPRQIVHIIYQK